MEATIAPSARAGVAHRRVSHQGRLYRFQKPLSGGQFRWACSRSGRRFRCPGYAVTDGPTQGCRVLRTGWHADHCDPIASASEVASIGAGAIARSGALGAAPPPRTVALTIAGESDPATHLLPDSSSLKRSAQSAVARARKRARADGEAGHVANYKNIGELSIPEIATRRPDGESFYRATATRGEDRILLFGPQGDIRSLSNAEVWGAQRGVQGFPRAMGPVVHSPRGG